VSCILDLYRSAVPNIWKDWGKVLPPTRAPGMILVPTADPSNNEAQSREVADLLHARVELLPNMRHGWMSQDLLLAAHTITRFQNDLPV
jgi:hypothetical protein